MCPILWDPMDCSLSLGFSRQEYWSGLPCPSPGDLPDPEIKTASLWPLHCRRILYHWTNEEAKWMLKNLNKVKLERGWLRCCVCLGFKHELKERQGDQLHFTWFSIDRSVRFVIQYYLNLQAKLAYCCFIHPGRRPTSTGSEPKDLLLTAQQVGWALVWVRFSLFPSAIYMDLAGWLCKQWVCITGEGHCIWWIHIFNSRH